MPMWPNPAGLYLDASGNLLAAGPLVAPNIGPSRVVGLTIQKSQRLRGRAYPFNSDLGAANSAFAAWRRGNVPGRIAMLGASTVAGWNSSQSGLISRRSMLSDMRDWWSRNVGSHVGIGAAPPSTLGGADARWTASGAGWALYQNVGFPRCCWRNVGPNSDTLTFADSSIEWDTAIVTVFQYVSSGGTVRFQATGGTAVDGTCLNATARFYDYTVVAATPSALNQLVITNTGSGANWLVYVQLYNSKLTPPLIFANCGAPAASAADWAGANNSGNCTALLGQLNPMVTMLAVGINDAIAGTVVDTYLANLQTIVDRVSTYSQNVVLLPLNPVTNPTTQAVIDSYMARIGEIVRCVNYAPEIYAHWKKLGIASVDGNVHGGPDDYMSMAMSILRRIVEDTVS